MADSKQSALLERQATADLARDKKRRMYINCCTGVGLCSTADQGEVVAFEKKY
jgi:hypothetical protein